MIANDVISRDHLSLSKIAEDDPSNSKHYWKVREHFQENILGRILNDPLSVIMRDIECDDLPTHFSLNKAL